MAYTESISDPQYVGASACLDICLLAFNVGEQTLYMMYMVINSRRIRVQKKCNIAW